MDKPERASTPRGFRPAEASRGAPNCRNAWPSSGVCRVRRNRRSLKIGAEYGRRKALATLASLGLFVLLGHSPMQYSVISTAAQASPARPLATSDGQDQGKPGAASPSAGFAGPGGAFTAPGPNGIRNLGHVCNWDTQDWEDLSDAEKQAFQILGWSRATWDDDNEDAASASGKAWSKLTPKERNAAQSLGYSAQDWDVVCPRDIPD
jgi:hypothetical protein